MIVDPDDFSPAALRAIAPVCGEGCAPGTVELVRGSAVYENRPDLADKLIWRCSCGARCGTHPNLKAVGTPAGPETRAARQEAHAAFDPLWQKRQRISGVKAHVARGRGYKWLAAQLGIEPKNCHIGEMDAATARRVVEVCKAARNERKSGCPEQSES